MGTHQIVKAKYSKGYQLIVKRMPKSTRESIIEMVTSVFPSAQVLQNTHQEYLSFEVLNNQDFSLSKAFGLLSDDLKSNGYIEDFSVKQRTLEDVLTSIAKYRSGEKQSGIVDG